ncbi:NAD(P)H-dependent glycerol-3-phosphate dehydrogenase [Gilvimarinus agarilyticus]|uniref:NAD(P)H-dependent glycerol-3-phosphate dehydrogenase n=1 Tax=unclassified Gilvimarinus TaxID=2642066 RepID=UPI001C084C78|nr:MULTISPECIES: NAD(P)H-dependent glycerol-3-phosphate dehydrogenase [unclassified Gilvimarinus]MBU2885062.1 NAD(P)H-dependent glycerol-3-phosphate dehydrogenase [Gilvimarinus agarilyticus]MDO6569959.1 NAD(P)H-dependent glycerol-3-phosphate dehydrogenase [Gilvimarinus sp. 2_MG-2023]MDO6747225.1 NAD(P)H-dependent glycerol-3-phosphate dehydrogenase [Gilvimarinus sp. 1_MG-2023]
MTKQLKVAVLGGGSFGTAIANIIALNGHETYLWMRDAQNAEACRQQHENTRYLPGFTLTESLQISSDLEHVMAATDLVFVSIPSHSFRRVCQLIKPLLKPDAVVISTAKGIEPGTFNLMSDILLEELPGHDIGVISGPNFAKEIVAGQHTATVVASESKRATETVQSTLSSATFRVYANEDREGVELAGALKNIYAIICGMAAAFGAGKNTQAMLLTRSLAEMGRFAGVMGGNPMTFLGLAGVGDLILTCTSDLSRNYRVGYSLGKGQPLDEVVAGLGQVAEGVNTLQQVKERADQLDVYMPLASGLYSVLFERRAIADVVNELMLGEQSNDVEFIGNNHGQ